MQAFTFDQPSRRVLALQFAQQNLRMEVSAIGGRAWQQALNEQLGVNMLDEIRGLLTTHPDIFLFELGTNDALLIAKTRLVKSDITTEEARRFTVAQIAQTLAEVEAYAHRYQRVCKGLHPVNNARIADWATVSAGERVAAHMPDGIHLANAAAVEFRALWVREIAGCEKQSADL